MKTDFVRRRLLGAMVASSVVPGAARAQAFPSKTVRIVVPTPPGSSVDIAARLIAERLRVKLGVAVVVDNKPGAGGTIAAAEVARAAPDGHTLFAGFNGPLATAPYVFQKLAYQPLEDFAPVIATVSQPHVLVVNAADPAPTLPAFIARLKASPGRENYASVGNASASHLTMELLKSEAGLFVVHIPYNGGPAATQALVAGDVQALFTAWVNVQGLVSGGRLRALGLAASSRSASLPGVPTFAEHGLPAVDAPLWNAIVAPAKTPAETLSTLNRAIDSVLAEAEVRARLASGGMEVIGGPAQTLARLMRDESARWKPVIDRLGIRPG
jgi:tripartite-type tricarboxylate transporter receptor subunit TctC